MDPNGIAPDDREHISNRPSRSKISMHTVATSQIDPHDTYQSRVSTSTNSLLGSERSFGSWCKYPSHTRAERTGSAGTLDNVIVYDFALDHIQHHSAAELRYKPSKLKKKKSSSIRDHFKNLWSRERSDTLRMKLGTRSSISAGGAVRYPDLELLPRLEQDFAEFSGSYYSSSDPDKTLQFGPVDYEGHGYGSDLDLQSISYTGDRASELSKMYQRAIFGQTSEVIDSADASRQVSASLPVEPSLLGDSVQKHDDLDEMKDISELLGSDSSPACSTQVLSVRKSTLDFARGVKLQEAEYCEILLDGVEDVVG